MYILGKATLSDRERLLDDSLLADPGLTNASAIRGALGFSTSDPSGFLPGQVIQEVVVTRSTNDTTTSATFVNTGLSASITPLLNDSVIEAIAIVPRAQVQSVTATNLIQRSASFRIRNSTNAVIGPEFKFGRNLTAASNVGAASLASMVVHMRYTVNSLAARTFVLDFAVNNDTDLEVQTRANDAEVTMILREIKQ